MGAKRTDSNGAIVDPLVALQRKGSSLFCKRCLEGIVQGVMASGVTGGRRRIFLQSVRLYSWNSMLTLPWATLCNRVTRLEFTHPANWRVWHHCVGPICMQGTWTRLQYRRGEQARRVTKPTGGELRART